MHNTWSNHFSSMARRTPPPDISWLMAQALEVPGLISLAAGFVDQASLPHDTVLQILTEMLRDKTSRTAALQYGTTQGDLSLRIQLVERLCKEGVFHPQAPIDESSMIIGSGSQQILYLAAEALLNEDDIVLLEAPTYFVVLGVFKARNARMIGIDTDRDGIIPERLESCLEELAKAGELHRVKMLYLMTYSTNPLGVTLAVSRRKRLFEILQHYQQKGFPILLVEDAAYRRLGFTSPMLPPIKSQDEHNDLILYIESFSKSLSPGIRLGFGGGPASIINKMVDLKGNHDFGSSNFTQQLLKRLLLSGIFDRHVEQLRRIYAQKSKILLKIMDDAFPSGCSWFKPTGGFYTWITLPGSIDAGPQSDLFKQALQEKVLYVPGCLCYSPDRPESRRSSSLRLSFGMIDENQLLEGCKRLATAIRKVLVA